MKVHLRHWHTVDLESLVKYANNPVIAKNIMDMFPHPYTGEVGIRFIERGTGNNGSLIQAIDLGGEAIGSTGLFPQTDSERKNAEMGYWLSESYWGKGIITTALKEMLETGFAPADIARIFVRLFGKNSASQKLPEKYAFILEASIVNGFFKHGVYIDTLIYPVRQDGFNQ